MAKSSSRLVSLDILRGMTVAFMIIVNTPGSWDHIYSVLRHSSWNGCTPTDLVFPFFLFIVGVSMWYSMKNYGNELTGGLYGGSSGEQLQSLSWDYSLQYSPISKWIIRHSGSWEFFSASPLHIF